MESISMSPKELLVLASKLGAATFYGLQDPFRGMSRAEIKASIPQLQMQAEKRGLAIMGFEQDFAVEAKAAELISVCANCERYMTVDSIASGKRRPREVVYYSKNKTVLLQDHTEEIILQKADANVLRDLIYQQYFSEQVEKSPQDEGIRIPPTLLGKLRILGDCGGEQLKEYGCSEEMADAIMQGLNGRCTYLSMVCVDLQKRSCLSLLCILSGFGIVRLWLENDAGDEYCRANWISHQGIAEELSKLFQGF